VRAASSKAFGVIALVVALSHASGEAQTRNPRARPLIPALRNPAGSPPLNPTGRPPLNPTGRSPLNPTGPSPLNPTGPSPLNPTGAPPLNPTGDPPLNPTGSPPLNPTGDPPLNPTGPPPLRPTGETPLDPTGDPPLNPTGPSPLDPTGAFFDVADDRGAAEVVARSFFCGGHGRGFASRESFAAHLDREHGATFAEAADFLVDDGGVWVLPSW
jgi:hypothetical protein